MSYQSKTFDLSITTQGPTYPPSEIMDEQGNFIVIGNISRKKQKKIILEWGTAIVSQLSPVPEFGELAPYNILQELSLDNLGEMGNTVLHTLPLPLPCNNYPILFAPEQNINGDKKTRKSYPLHQAPIADFREEDGRKITFPITLRDWIQAKGQCKVKVNNDQKFASFKFDFEGLIPESLYTVMSLREDDLNPKKLRRPGPLGVPNVFITDHKGCANYTATLLNPFPSLGVTNRVINVIVLWMSSQCSYGGAIGLYGLGGDIHAQLKLPEPSFFEFNTKS